MTTKKQRRFEDLKGRKKKKNIRIVYLAVIIGGSVLLLGIFFVILFNAIFPPVDSTAHKKKERRPVEVYFSDTQELFLVSEERYVFVSDDSTDLAGELVRALLEGSKVGHVNTFPAGVTLRDIKVDKNGLARVNFSEDLIRLHPGGSAAEMATIYSLTNTLSRNVATIKSVQILIEGREIESLRGHIAADKPFEPDPAMLVGSKQAGN